MHSSTQTCFAYQHHVTCDWSVVMPAKIQGGRKSKPLHEPKSKVVHRFLILGVFLKSMSFSGHLSDD